MLGLFSGGAAAQSEDDTHLFKVLSPADRAVLKNVVVIWLDVKTSTWRQGAPLDVRSSVKEKLERAGFKVGVEREAKSDATLLIRYQESEHTALTFIPGGPGTVIGCDIRFEHPKLGLVFRTWITTSTSPSRKVTALYRSAIDKFEREELYYLYLGSLLRDVVDGKGEVPTLIVALRSDRWHVRHEAETRLGRIRERSAIEPLMQALFFNPTEPDWGAAEALGRLGDTRATDVLLTALRATNWGTRLRVVEALGQLKDKKALGSLTSLATNDPSETVKAAARAAVLQIEER